MEGWKDITTRTENENILEVETVYIFAEDSDSITTHSGIIKKCDIVSVADPNEFVKKYLINELKIKAVKLCDKLNNTKENTLQYKRLESELENINLIING